MAEGGWRLRHLAGVTNRGHSVWPGPGSGGVRALEDRIVAVERFYAERGLPAIATAAACRAKKEELTLAVGMSLIFTSIMMLLMPTSINGVGMAPVPGGAGMGGTGGGGPGGFPGIPGPFALVYVAEQERVRASEAVQKAVLQRDEAERQQAIAEAALEEATQRSPRE